MEGGGSKRCVRAVRRMARVRFRRAFRRTFWPLFRSALRFALACVSVRVSCAFQCAFRPGFRRACEAAHRACDDRGVEAWTGEGTFAAVPPPSEKKTASRRGSGLVRLSAGGRRAVPCLLSPRFCYRTLQTSCFRTGGVASGLAAGRAEPVSSLTGDAPSMLTVRFLRKTGPMFPAASFAAARK